MFFRKKKQVALSPEDVRGKLHHIAFIMDGNGRYAKRRGLPREQGHIAGAKNFLDVARHCREIGIDTVTVYAFSTENWSRPESEVAGLMKLFEEHIMSAFEKCKKEHIRVIFLGDKAPFSASLREKAERLEQETAAYTQTLNIAMNYGSRDELVRACNQLIAEGKTEVTKDDISAHLFTKGSPDPDLVVRTGGELRVSNFLLWQSAYAEYYFTETLWPALKANEIDDIVRAYMKRHRRFGGL